MTVIDFQKAAEKIEPMIWTCICGNCSFYIYVDGSIECAKCDTFQSNVTEHYQAIRRWTRKVDNFEDAIIEESRIDG